MIQRQRPAQMARPADKKFVPCLILTFGLLLFMGSPYSYLGGAQTRSRKPRSNTPPPGSKSQPTPSPTPKRSLLDMLGEPPPAPTPKATPEQDVAPGEVIKVETTEVMLPVTVRDDGGRLVNELKREDFRVFEDGQEQPLSGLALRQVPVDVVLMIDASSSATRNLDDFRRAAEGFAQRLGPDDRISLMKFDDTVLLLQDWTKSRFQLQRALNRVAPGMFTRFNDALLLAAREQYGATQSRRAVIVLTDGIDSGRGTTLENALRALLQSQVTVYVVSNTEISRAEKQDQLNTLTGGSESQQRFNKIQIDGLNMELRALDQSEELLEQLTAATGGRLYKPRSFNALEGTYAEVAEELRHQYALYFSPLNKNRDGSFRHVRVETVNRTFHPLTRVGYYAPRK